MVQNILNGMYKEIRGLHQAAYILAIFTFGSQLLALIRDRLLAHQFGASIELDLYYTAFRIPDFFYVLFVSTLSIYVLIPFISKHVEEGFPVRAQVLLSQIFSLFCIGYSVIACIAILYAPQLVTYLFPGFVEHTETLTLLIRILLLQPLLLGISSLFGVITQMEHRFILYAVSPLLYNLGIIVGVLLFYPRLGIAGLAYGVVLGALGHLLVQIPIVRMSPIRPHFTALFSFTALKEVFRVSMVRALTLGLHQCVLLGFVGFASIMAVGSISVFQFAYNLQSVPLAIIGMSYSVAAFPILTQMFAQKRFFHFGEHIMTALRHILFWSLPAITLFIVVRAQFVRVVLGSGAFDWDDTRLTAAVFALFILSLTSQAIHLLLIRALYAAQNTRLPLLVTLVSSSCALFLAFIFYTLLLTQSTFTMALESVMRLEGVHGIEVLALPLGYTCALWIHTVLILVYARRIIYISIRKLVRPFFQAITSAVVGGFVAYTILNYIASVFTITTLIAVLFQGMFGAFCGFGAYLCVQYFFRNQELLEMSQSLRQRFVKGKIIVPQEEDTAAV
jgi:putative peptidoglycan lipid II flippase